MTPDLLRLQQVLAGRYSLERELGRGGMGIVYLARDAALDRPVAIKLLPPDMAGDAELKERFLREARTAAQLSHPNVVPIHVVEEKDGLVYFVMAFIDGESLGERVRRAGPLRHGDAVKMIQEVAWALAYAHGRGVVHRDIKPDNILLERVSGRALVTDFGIARSATAPALTSKGLILGTLQYMAPEQTDPDAPIDGRADLYALGVTSFFALTGRLPFEIESVPALIAAHVLEPPPPIASIAPSVPAKLAEAVDRCLAKSPDARWPNGEALAAAIGEMGAGTPPTPPTIRAFITATGSTGTQLMVLVMVAIWGSLMMPEQQATVLKLLGIAALVPLVGLLAAGRALAIAGFGVNDISRAVAEEAKASDRYTEYTREQLKVAARQLRSRWGRLVLFLLGALELGTGVGVIIDAVSKGVAWKLALLLPVGAIMMWFGVELVGHGLQVGRFKERLQRFFENSPGRGARMTAAAWRSLPVRWLLALTRVGTKNTMLQAPGASTTNAPTAVIMAKAAGDVFDALPENERRALAGVPDALKGLEAAAAKLRERRARLDDAIAAVGDADGNARRTSVSADLETQRGLVEQRLKGALEALENLRLDLLKLRAGIGSTDDLTEALESARRIGQDVDHTIQGRREANRIA